MERLINEDNYKEYANYYKEKEIYNELVKMGYDKDLIRSLKQILGGTLWDEENRIYREMRKEFEDNIFKREYKEKVEKGKQALDKLPKIPKEENTVENNLLNTNYQNYQKSIDVYLKAEKEFRSMTSDEYKEFQKYTSNCQSCAQTFILRQKGYNVKAKLSGNTSEDYKLREKGWDLAMFIPKTDKGFEIHSANYYTSTRKINTFADNYIKYYKSNSDLANYSIGGQVKSIIDIALRDGDDSTYLLQVGWKGYDMGEKPENDSVSGAHVMVVKNENGKVMLYDPQNNTKEYLNNPEYTIGYADVNNGVFKRVNLNYTNLIRVDDLEINDNIDLIAEAM